MKLVQILKNSEWNKIGITFILIMSILLLSPISGIAQTNGIAIIWDVSVSRKTDRKTDTKDFANKIYGELALNNKRSGQGANFYLGTVGENSFPKVDVISLQPVNWLMTPKDVREDSVQEFKDKFETGINKLFTIPLTDQGTFFYRGVVYIAEQMNREEDYHKMIIFSDLLESSILFQISDLKPKDILPNYENIKKKLTADTPIPDIFQEMEIVLVCNGINEIEVQTARFWKKFFESAGSTVYIRTSY